MITLGVRMTSNIINSIAIDLIKLENEPKLPLMNPKLYSSSGLILESYSKLHKISRDSLKSLVATNPFFKLGKFTIQTGLFTKKDKAIDIITWESEDAVIKKYISDPEKLLQKSTESKLLMQKIIKIIMKVRAEVVSEPKKEKPRSDFEYSQEDHTKLYNRYFPEEMEKYQHEGRHETDLEKKFRSRVPSGSEFHFSDGKVAHNLLTWVQCIQMAASDVVGFHVMNNDFYHWLEDAVKTPELARITYSIMKSVQAGELTEKEVKVMLLKNINKTSLSNIIFETLTTPLLRALKSEDQSKAQDAIDRLVSTGDDRVVKPLMNRLFDSSQRLRQKIIIGLGKLGDKQATPMIIKILKHSSDDQDRLLAIKTLETLSDPRAKKVLTKLAKEDNEVGIEAARVVNNLKNG
jgi:aspartate/glutamate racemase